MLSTCIPKLKDVRAQYSKASGIRGGRDDMAERQHSFAPFFERFSRGVGVAAMEYLLGWRMAFGKDLMRCKEATVAEVADHVCCSSPSTFSVAFARHVGLPPTHYAREQA